MSRVLLKLSGEALSGDKGSGFDEEVCSFVAGEIARISKAGHEVGIVIGGGNFWRGRSSKDMDRVTADQIGMMATIMNCLYMSDMLRRNGMQTLVMTPYPYGSFTRVFSKDSAIKNLEKGRIVLFAGGTGHPYFSTDTTTVLMALEIEAEAILLAKAVDGIYDADPKKNPDAKKYKTVSIDEIVDKKLQAMDLTASIMCMENKMPLIVFSLREKDSILKSMPGPDGKPKEGFDGTYVSA